MKKQEKRSVTEERIHTTEVTCDLCGRKANHNSSANMWTGEPFGVAEVEITMREGFSYPEDYRWTRTECDVCCDCFKTKLMPWLESQGVTFREYEVD